MSKKYVYLFSEGNGSMRELLGGKGANLAEMTNLGMPVPPGFIITTEACTQYYNDNEQISPEIQDEIMQYVDKLETMSGQKFGDRENPLLVSVRSGHNVLALGVHKELAKELLFAGCGVSGKRYTRTGVVIEVSKRHLDNRDCRSPGPGYIIHSSIVNSPVVVP